MISSFYLSNLQKIQKIISLSLLFKKEAKLTKVVAKQSFLENFLEKSNLRVVLI